MPRAVHEEPPDLVSDMPFDNIPQWRRFVRQESRHQITATLDRLIGWAAKNFKHCAN
jgi:hypothetical protein